MGIRKRASLAHQQREAEREIRSDGVTRWIIKHGIEVFSQMFGTEPDYVMTDMNNGYRVWFYQDSLEFAVTRYGPNIAIRLSRYCPMCDIRMVSDPIKDLAQLGDLIENGFIHKHSCKI